MDEKWINLKVRCHDNSAPFEEIHAKLLNTAKMVKLKEAYSRQVGIPVSSLRFLFNGHRIKDSQSPTALKLKHNDVIEVYQKLLNKNNQNQALKISKSNPHKQDTSDDGFKMSNSHEKDESKDGVDRFISDNIDESYDGFCNENNANSSKVTVNKTNKDYRSYKGRLDIMVARNSAEAKLKSLKKSLKARIDYLENEVSNKDVEINASSKTIKMLQRENRKLQTAHDILKEDGYVKDKEINSYIETNDKYIETNDKYIETNVRLEKDLSNSLKYVSSLQDQNAKDQNYILKLKESIKNYENERKEHEQINEKLNAQIDILIQEAKEEKDETVKALNSMLKTKSGELKAVKEKLNAKTKAHNDISTQLESSIKLNEELKSQMEILNQNNENNVILKKANEVVRSQLKEKTKAYDDISKDLTDMKSKNAELNNLLEIKSEELNSVKLQFDQFKDSTKVNEDVSGNVLSSKQLIEELKSQIKILNIEVDKKDDKLKKVDVLKSEKEEVKKQLSNEKIQSAKLIQIKKDDDQKITELQNDLQDAKEENESLKRKAKSLASISELEKETNSNSKPRDGGGVKGDDNLTQLALDLEESNKKNFTLEAKIKHLEKKTNHYTMSIQNFQKNIAMKVEPNSNDQIVRPLAENPIDQNDYLEQSSEKIVILETSLEEESVTRLNRKIAIKEEKIECLVKNKDQYWSTRVENLTHIIEMKKEANSNDQIVMPSAKDPANQNDYLEVREKLAESDEVNNAFQTLLRDKENIICRLEKRTEDCVCGRIVSVQSVEKRPMMDEQLNVEQHKRKRITY